MSQQTGPWSDRRASRVQHAGAADRHATPPRSRRRGSAIDVLNRATAEELTGAHRVGPYTAGQIVRYREQHGAFRSFEELLNVPNVSPEAVHHLRDWACERASAHGRSTPGRRPE